jgi:hypothetical protein
MRTNMLEEGGGEAGKIILTTYIAIHTKNHLKPEYPLWDSTSSRGWFDRVDVDFSRGCVPVAPSPPVRMGSRRGPESGESCFSRSSDAFEALLVTGADIVYSNLMIMINIGWYQSCYED